MKQEQNISVLPIIYIYIYTDTKDRYEERSVLPGNTYDIPPWHTAMTTTATISQIFSSTRWLYQLTPPLALWSKSWKWYTALHSIQLYIYISIVPLWIVSFGVEQVNRSVMHLFLCQIFMILSCCCCCCCCCCCVFHHNIYMLLLLLDFSNITVGIHRNWLW